MLFKAAHVILYGLCFAGFLSQCWELLMKYSKGLTAMSISNTLPTNGGLDLPRISICPDPPFSQTRLSELGLSQESWDVNQFSTNYQGTTQWPIISEDDGNLYDQSTHSFQEVVQTAVFVESQKKTLRLDQKQYYKETNTWYNGKCFTFLLEGISATTESLLRIDLKHVFGNETGRFKMFIHDHGMEMALVNQYWLTSKKEVLDLYPGTINDILIKKHYQKFLPSGKQSLKHCQSTWNSVDYYSCIDAFMQELREPFYCHSPFDFALNQSFCANQNPVCTTFNFTKGLINSQRKAFIKRHFSERCPESCNLVFYKTSTTETKIFGNNETRIRLVYGTMSSTKEEEVYIYDAISIISSLGGSLGLYLGFSVLEVGRYLLRTIQNHFLKNNNKG